MVTKQERKLLVTKYYLRLMEPLAILRQLREQHNIKCSKNTVYRDIEEAKIFMKQNLANELSSILTFQIHTRHELLGELWALFGSTNLAMH
jgi:predicted nucleic acid-binding protein